MKNNKNGKFHVKVGIIITALLLLILATGVIVMYNLNFTKSARSISIIGGADGPTSVFIAGKIGGTTEENIIVEEIMGYQSISMDEAQDIFDKGKGTYCILDVRTKEEYLEGHIKGAVNIPNEIIGTEKPDELPDMEQTIYVYCRSGRRSKQAAEKLGVLGYTNIVEIGGIIDWNGEIEK